MEKKDETPLQEIIYKPTTLHGNLSEALKPDVQPKTANLFPYIAAAIASLMAFAAGTAFGWTSPILPKLMMNDTDINPLGRPITHHEESWITGLVSMGAMIGPLGAGTMADKWGRKKTLLFLAVPMGISMVVIAFAKTVLLYYFMRITLGVGIGSVFTVLPMYLGEIAENHNRGTLGCFMGLFVSSGLLFAYIIGPYLSVRNFTLICTIPLLFFVLIFSYAIPESPQFLASINNVHGLELSLMKLRKIPPREAQKEASEILKTVQEEQKLKGGIKDLLTTKGLRKGLIISISLILFQQVSAISAVLCYMQTIFEAAGGGLAPEISTMIIGAVQVVVTIMTSYVVDKLGRKILFIISLLGCSVSLMALGAYFYLKNNNYDVDVIFWLPVLSLFVWMVAFSVGLGPLPWAVMGELFPSQVKSAASTLTSFSCFLGGFVVSLFFPIVVLTLGMALTFWIFAIGCVLGAAFIYLIVPETKGRSLQEIQRLLQG